MVCPAAAAKPLGVRPNAVSPLVEAVLTQPPEVEYVQSAVLPDSSAAKTIGIRPPTANDGGGTLIDCFGTTVEPVADGEPRATPV
jgi:hypothetical protein